MGVDTKAIIRKGVTIQEIEKSLSKKYKSVKVQESSMIDFMYISFLDGDDIRSLAISFNNSCETDDGICGVWLSLGAWGNSIEIARYLCEEFGGYLDENDCDEHGYYPINFNLYSKGVDFSSIDIFKHKVISKLGYDKLNDVMSLFEEFKNIK